MDSRRINPDPSTEGPRCSSLTNFQPISGKVLIAREEYINPVQTSEPFPSILPYPPVQTRPNYGHGLMSNGLFPFNFLGENNNPVSLPAFDGSREEREAYYDV